MRKIIAASLLALVAGLSLGQAAEEGFVEVIAGGGTRPSLAVTPPVPLGGKAAPETAAGAEVLRSDLGLSGMFTVAQETAPSSGGIREGEFDFTPWRANGTKLLIKSGYSLDGDRLVFEFRLYDVLLERQLAAKRYTGSLREIRRMAHGFADETLRAVTGEAGAFTSQIAFVSTRTGKKEINLMDWDGHGVQQITSNGSINLYPQFHPGGREILYTSYRKGNPDLYRRELYSGAEAALSRKRGNNITASFSPAGDRIALSMSKDGNAEIYLIDRQGAELARLTTNPAIDISPAWSPDGKHLAFVSDRFGKPQIFIMEANGSSPRRVPTPASYAVGPRWSPKGDRLVYSSREGGGFQIHTINPDGSGDVRLTSEGNNEHPAWSPDGRFIAFSSKRGGREEIHVMRADGTGTVRVTEGGGNKTQPVWSPRR